MRGAHLVMREDQVGPTGLDVEQRAEIPRGNRRALHMPAWPARAEWSVPGRFPWPRGQPYQGVKRIFLARPARVATALRGEHLHGRATEPGHRSERVVASPGEVHIPVQVIQGAPVAEQSGELLDVRQCL